MSEAMKGKSVIKTMSSGVGVACNELTVAKVRELLQFEAVGDAVDELLLEELRLVDLPFFTCLTREQLYEMLPSDLALLEEGCKEANPSFFRLLAALGGAQKKA